MDLDKRVCFTFQNTENKCKGELYKIEDTLENAFKTFNVMINGYKERGYKINILKQLNGNVTKFRATKADWGFKVDMEILI